MAVLKSYGKINFGETLTPCHKSRSTASPCGFHVFKMKCTICLPVLRIIHVTCIYIRKTYGHETAAMFRLGVGSRGSNSRSRVEAPHSAHVYRISRDIGNYRILNNKSMAARYSALSTSASLADKIYVREYALRSGFAQTGDREAPFRGRVIYVASWQPVGGRGLRALTPCRLPSRFLYSAFCICMNRTENTEHATPWPMIIRDLVDGCRHSR